MTSSIGPIEAFMTADHVGLDRFLERADAGGRSIDMAAFESFRRGMLRHIAMEETVLMPLARARCGRPLAIESVMRDDHARIARLLAAAPTPATLARVREALAVHNPLEEGLGGLYAQCDAVARADAKEVVALLRATKELSPRSPETESPGRGVP